MYLAPPPLSTQLDYTYQHNYYYTIQTLDYLTILEGICGPPAFAGGLAFIPLLDKLCWNKLYWTT